MKNLYYPLSYQQKKLYAYSEVHEDDTEYNVVEGLEFKTQIDYKKMEYAVKRILVEEPILRCRITMQDFKPCQYQADIQEYEIVYEDIVKEELSARIQQLKTKPFSITDGKLFNIHILNVENKKSVLLLVLHHIICDGWSLQLLMQKLVNYYYMDNNREYKEPEYSYYDYALEQEDTVSSEIYQERKKYWKKVMEEYSMKLDISSDFSREKSYTRDGKRELFFLDQETSEKVNEYCRINKLSPFSFIFTVYGDLFHRYSGQKKFSIAVPVANRFKKKVMGLTGYFVNTIPMPFDLSEKMSVARRTKSNHLDFMRVIAKSDTDLECKCNVMFVFQSRPGTKEKDFEKYFDILRLYNNKSKYEISLSVTYENGRYGFEWEYMVELFKRKTIEQFNKHLFYLIKGYLESSDVITDKISMLDEEEVNLQKNLWNNTEEVFTENKNLKKLVEESTHKNAEEIALIYEGQSITYKQFEEYTNILCSNLQKLGLKPKSVVPILFERSFEMVIVIHALIKLGCAYLPLDKKIPMERMRFICENSNAQLILVGEELQNMVNHIGNSYVVNIKELVGSAENPIVITQADDAAYVIYTSGSTGNPKGVVNTCEGLCNRLNWMQKQFPIGPGVRVLQKTPYTFDVSVWELVWPILMGATMVIAKPGGHKNPEYIVDIINKEHVNVIHFVPSMLKRFLRVDECRTCASLKYVICSGEALELNTVRTYYSKLNAQLANLYGPTEAAIDVSVQIINKNEIGERIPIGKPISNIRLYKLNDELMFEPPEVPGELYISGIGLAKGYLNSPEKTKAFFLPCPWGDEPPYERIYKTGDLVTIDENGTIFYINRKDSQVKIRGQRIELSEIENRIKEVKGVKEAIVLVKQKDKDDEQVLVAYVVSEDKNQQVIIDYISKYLMEYMIPKVFCFVESIPVNVNGKADRKKLMQYEIDLDIEEEFEEAQDKYEKIVSLAFSEVLELKKVSRNADFYMLGGTSLSFYDIKLYIEQNLSYKIPYEVIMGSSVVSDIAACIRGYLEEHRIREKERIDLEKELNIFSLVVPESRNRKSQKVNIFLTGATGFLGAFLMRDYLEADKEHVLYCLVRAENSMTGLHRLEKNMIKWGVWKESYRNRFFAVCGNLSKEKMGLQQSEMDMLADTIDIICHNGAEVNFSLPYYQIKQTNVLGTSYIAELLTTGKRKRMEYVSTISIFSKEDYEQGIVMEQQMPLDVNNLKLGYAQSKVVSEQLLHRLIDKGYDIDVFRVGRITGSMLNGIENQDMFYKMIQLCRKMQKYPDILMNFNCIPVDVVSKLIVYASCSNIGSTTYHVVNPDSCSEYRLEELFGECGLDIKKVSWEEWYQCCTKLVDNNDVLAKQVFISLNDEVSDIKTELNSDHMKQLIKECNIEVPKIKELLKKIILQ